MRRFEYAGGKDLKEMFAAATTWLENGAADIDALNVFPVPDGDTGTNMLLTMRAALEEASRATNGEASTVAEALAGGALLEARGNSGVILSQIWLGLAQGLKEKESFTASDLAAALQRSSALAYRGVSNPVEGTILTVIKDVAAAAAGHTISCGNDLAAMMEIIVDAAQKSTANTPNLLPVLRESGVVDAGGQGLYTIFAGALRFLRAETVRLKSCRPQMIVGQKSCTQPALPAAAQEQSYGYCTGFLIEGKELDAEKIKALLKDKGESLMVVGNEKAVRVHIHTLHPDSVIRSTEAWGMLHQVHIRNMDE